MNKNKGFTLIELLVVIAIIGILASVVLASLNSARAKGQDAAIKSDLAGVRASTEVLYDSFAYRYSDSSITTAVNACTDTAAATHVFNDANIISALQHADKSAGGSGALASSTNVACRISAAGDAYAVSAKLRSGGASAKHWCVDSLGNAKEIDNALATDTTVCP